MSRESKGHKPENGGSPTNGNGSEPYRPSDESAAGGAGQGASKPSLEEELILIKENSTVFHSYPFSKLKAALDGEISADEWAEDLAEYVDGYLLQD